jgi:hypothetical protein
MKVKCYEGHVLCRVMKINFKMKAKKLTTKMATMWSGSLYCCLPLGPLSLLSRELQTCSTSFSSSKEMLIFLEPPALKPPTTSFSVCAIPMPTSSLCPLRGQASSLFSLPMLLLPIRLASLHHHPSPHRPLKH